MHLAIENVVDGRRVVTAIEQRDPALRADDAAHDRKLAQAERLHVAEQVNALLDRGQRLVHVHAPAADA